MSRSTRRADRSLSIPIICGQRVANFANDSRTEIVVEIGSALTICPAVPTPLTPVRIGFPRVGHHVVLLKDGGSVVQTQFIVAEKSLEKLDYSDLWDVESESGWGLTINQHGKDRFFGVLFGYRNDGKPLWLSLQLPDWDSATRVSGDWLVSRGTSQLGPYDAAKGGAYGAARGTLEFLSADTAVLTLARFGENSVLGLPADRSWTLRRNRF